MDFKEEFLRGYCELNCEGDVDCKVPCTTINFLQELLKKYTVTKKEEEKTGDKSSFKFKFEITRTEEGYQDDIRVSGASLEVLGAIEKMFAILEHTKQKIIEEIVDKDQ
jgi:hypothetical protein